MGCSIVLVRVPVSFMQKAGTYRFVLRVWDNHAHLHKDHQVKPALEMNADWETPKLLLSWVPMRQGQEFGSNPGNGKPATAIGKRLFADLPVPPDQLPPNDDRDAYRKAKVVIQVWDEPKAIKIVYLRLFDPDDPSAPDTQEELPIDSNDEVVQNPMGGVIFIRRGNDNRGDATNIPATGIFEVSKGIDHQVDVNLNEKGYGMTEVTVVLSRQPGNNFKVAGAFDEGVRNGLHIKEGTQEQALRVWTADGKKVPEGSEPDIEPVARATELLTVWRRLHVEMDSMGAVTGNTMRGTVVEVEYDPNRDSYVVTTDQILDDSVDRFENGIFDTGVRYKVISNTNGMNFKVIIQANEIFPMVGDKFTLVDDDYLVDGYDVPEPKTYLLREKFLPAYIEVLLDGGGSNTFNQTDAPFVLNFPSGLISDLEAIARQSRQSRSYPDFWSTHCCAAFQYKKEPINFRQDAGDADPNPKYDENGNITSGEGTIQGISSWVTAFWFAESSYEYYGNHPLKDSIDAHVIVHEIEHNFRLLDEFEKTRDPEYNGIMGWVWKGIFTPENISSIRSIDYPSKEGLR